MKQKQRRVEYKDCQNDHNEWYPRLTRLFRDDNRVEKKRIDDSILMIKGELIQLLRFEITQPPTAAECSIKTTLSRPDSLVQPIAGSCMLVAQSALNISTQTRKKARTNVFLLVRQA